MIGHFLPTLRASLHAVWSQASCQVPISLSFGQQMWMFYVSCIERYSRLEEEKHCEIFTASNSWRDPSPTPVLNGWKWLIAFVPERHNIENVEKTSAISPGGNLSCTHA